MEAGKTIIEVNGVKLEVDLTTARKVEEYRVGDRIKVLVKSYGDKYDSYPGVIVGFDPFVNLPTILIAYLKQSYSSSELVTVAFNTKTEDVEICQANPDELLLDKGGTLDLMDREILKAERELADLKRKKEWFSSHFALYFKDAEEAFQRAMGEKK